MSRRRGSGLCAASAVAVAVAALAAAAAGRADAPPPADAAGGADSREALLVRAVETYTRALDEPERDRRLEEFRSAERLFSAAADRGAHNPELFTNLGNAALQAEHLGSAILAYRRALALDAGSARALQNLAHARSLLPEWLPRPQPAGVLDSFFFWHRTLPRPQRALLAAACFGVAALLLALATLLRQGALRSAALVPGLAWLVLLGSVVFDSSAEARGEAVVTADEVVARAADSALAPAAFPDPLPAGAEVRILESRPPWVRVRLANGRDAWLLASGVSAVTDAAAP